MNRQFTVPGQPQGKGRPRFSVAGGYARAYTPDRTASYENLVKLSYEKEHGQTMVAGPLKMVIRAYYSLPSSWSKSKRLAALNREIYPVVKPDMDNVIKVICDSLNGIAYLDDKQIVSIEMFKRYDVVPHIEVAARANEKMLSEVYRRYPLALNLHFADQKATYFDEKQ